MAKNTIKGIKYGKMGRNSLFRDKNRKAKKRKTLIFPNSSSLEGAEPGISRLLDDVDSVGGFPKDKAGACVEIGTLSIGGNQEMSATAIHDKLYLLVVGNDDGTHVEAMRCNGCEQHNIGLRMDDGATCTERIGRRASGGTY